MGDAIISLLGGLTETLEERRRRNVDQSRLDVDQQQSIFRWLLENPDPEIKAIGLAGILEPPKKTLFGHLKDSDAGRDALALAKRMSESGPGIPSPPSPVSQPGAAGMPDVPPLTGGGGATGPSPVAAPSGAGGVPPIDWPAGIPAVGGGPSPAALPPAAPAAPSIGPPPAAPLELAAGAVPQGPSLEQPQGPSSPEQAEQQVRGFLQGVTPKEALESMERADPDQMQEGLRPLRLALQEAVFTGATMEQVLAQTFQVAAKEGGRLTREELKAETRLAVAQAGASARVQETIFKTDAQWERDRAKGKEAMERLEKAVEVRLATGGGTWESKLEKRKWADHVGKVREKIVLTKIDFVALETGINSLRGYLADYTNPKASTYEQQKSYNNFTLTVESMLGTVAKANDEGKRISDKDADRFRGALKPFLVDVGPDAWARFDPGFALEKLDLSQAHFTRVRNAKLEEYYKDLEAGPGIPTRPPPEPEDDLGGGAVTVKTQAEVDALPDGTTFIWTDGKQYRKD